MKKKEKIQPEVIEAAENSQESTKKSPKTVLNTIINVVLVIAIVIAAVATYVSFVSSSGQGAPNIFGLRLLSIQTNSMADTLMPGDLVISVGVKDKSTLRPRDIITYWTVINGERVLNTHRIINIYDGGDYLIFETQGDNNTSVDPLTVHQNEIIGKYKFRLPGVGKVFDYLQTPTGFLLIVVVPVFIFFIYHLVQFFRVLFEYQNVKNRIKYEQERGRTEDLIAAQQEEQARKEAERAQMEAELREKLRAELLESMAKEQQAAKEAAETKAEEEPKEEPKEE